MRQLVECETPYCYNCFFVTDEKFSSKQHKGNKLFCGDCSKEHSYHVLTVQADYEKSIKEIILEAKFFNTASGMADYIGVSFVTIYHWIKKYFGITFQEFKRDFICKSEKCYLVNIEKSPYSRGDYVLKKIRDERHCACINELGSNFMMTNAPLGIVSQILDREITDRKFLFRKSKKLLPIYMNNPPSPIYVYDLISKMAIGA